MPLPFQGWAFVPPYSQDYVPLPLHSILGYYISSRWDWEAEILFLNLYIRLRCLLPAGQEKASAMPETSPTNNSRNSDMSFIISVETDDLLILVS